MSYDISLVEKLKSKFHVDSLQSADWQRGFNEGLDEAIKIIRQHSTSAPIMGGASIRKDEEVAVSSETVSASNSDASPTSALDDKAVERAIKCIAECRDTLSAAYEYMEGNSTSFIYAKRQVKKQIDRCELGIAALNQQHDDSPQGRRIKRRLEKEKP